MTKKDYIRIAAIIKASKTKEQIVLGLDKMFKEDNPRYDSDKFLAAVRRDRQNVQV